MDSVKGGDITLNNVNSMTPITTTTINSKIMFLGRKLINQYRPNEEGVA